MSPASFSEVGLLLCDEWAAYLEVGPVVVVKLGEQVDGILEGPPGCDLEIFAIVAVYCEGGVGL